MLDKTIYIVCLGDEVRCPIPERQNRPVKENQDRSVRDRPIRDRVRLRDRRPRRTYKNTAHVEYATVGWVDRYNDRRLHGTLGYITPECETAQYAALNPERQPAFERHRTGGASALSTSLRGRLRWRLGGRCAPVGAAAHHWWSGADGAARRGPGR